MSFSNKLGIHILLFLIATFIACTDNDIQENNNNLPPKDEPTPPQEEAEEHLFDILNLDYPGLEEIKSLYKSGENDAAMQKLLTYYRSRTAIENPNLTATLNDTEQGYADYAIDEYRFYVNDNYLEDKDRKIPYSLKSNDQTINWQFAPEGADNEYQKQLHRHNWIPMQGKAYQKSKNEKYMLSYTVPDIVGVYDGANYGMLGSNGELIVPCSYDSCEISEDGAYITADRQKDEYGNYTECTLFDSNGNKIETFDTGIYNVGVFRKISNAA